MTTLVIRNKSLITNNARLPIVYTPPLSGDAGHWKINTNSGSLVDLSGNNNTLTAIGTPTFTSTGGAGDQTNGWDTGVTDSTPSLTVMAVIKPSSIAADYRLLPVTNLSLGSGPSAVGINLYCVGNDPSYWQAAAMLATASSRTQATVNTNTVPRSGDTAAQTRAARARFVAARFDATLNKVSIYVPDVAATPYSLTPASGTWPSGVAGRPLGGTFRLLARVSTFPSFSQATAGELSYARIFKRALTDAELQLAFAEASAYMATLGVTLV